MLDQLGLGITLSMNDDFTPQANKAMKTMTRFESQADTMSKNVQKSMYNLQNIMLAGFSLNTVGNSIQRTGASILKLFKGIGAEVANVNASYQTNQAQLLTAFKGNAEEAKKAFDWVRKYSESTPYEVSGLTTAFQRLKTSGIDMRNSFKNAKGELTTMAEAIGDLATRNMTSTGGVSGMAYALQEAWSGQTRSIINRFNLARADIADMMKYAGKDQAKFAEEFIKLADKFAPDAMKNMQGTWAQVVSNMEDTWNNFMYDVGQAGIFNEMIKTLGFIQKEMSKVFGDKSNIKALSNILSSLWKPIDSIIIGLAKIVGHIIEFSKQHPKLTKILVTATAMGGVFLVLSGFVMKLTGSFLILGASLASTYLNFKLIQKLNMAGDFDFMGKSASRAGRTFGILGLTVAGLALAMKSNFMGIRDKAENAFTHLRVSWQKSDYVIKNGVSSLERVGEEYDSLTRKFVKLRMFGLILKNTFFGQTDKDGGILYTEDEVDRLRRFGFLPMAQTFAILKGRAINFFNGLKEGLGSAFVIAKNFLDIVLTPIKTVLETIGVKFNPIKNVSTKLGLNGDAGMDAKKAEEQTKMFEDVGQKAGILLGSILGFKIIKTISPILTSPFKLMSKAISGSIKSVGKLKDSMKSGLGTVGGAIGAPISGVKNFFKGNAQRAGKRFNSYLNEYQELPTHYRRSDMTGYSKVKSAPSRFTNFVAPNTYGEVDANNLYTKNRSSLGQKLLGNTYYTKGADDQLHKVGRWGGRLNSERDDQQLIMALQRQQANTGVKGKIKPPTLADFNGDKEAYRNTMKHFPKLDSYIGNASQNLKGLSPSELDARQSSYLKSNKMWRNRYKLSGVDGRKLNSEQKSLVDSEMLTRITNNSPELQNINKQRALGSTQLFASNRQSRLSRALFGRKLYTQELNADGTQSRRVVARTGGLFRKSSEDMTYNPEKTIGERFRGSRFATGVKSRFSKIAGGVSRGVSSTTGALREQFMNTRAGRILGAGTGFINSQRRRFDIDDGSTKTKKTLGQKVSGGFNYLFGKEKRDEGDSVIQRAGLFRRGASKVSGFGSGIKRVGKGIGKVGGRILGGAGKLLGGAGGLAMRALPIAGMALGAGKMGFDMIKQKGGGDFGKGLKLLKADVSKIDLTSIWKKFQSSAKSSFGTIGEIAKIAFNKLKESLPTILDEAWKGIQGMAGTAWQFIKDNGAKAIGDLVGWIISDGIPLLFKAILGIGKWMLTDFLPFLLDVVKQIVPKIVDGFKSLGKMIGDILLKGLVGAIRLLLPKALETPVLETLGLPTHHGGLYMSPNEHMALIRKDETVLPPDISKGFDDILNNNPRNPKTSPVSRGNGGRTNSSQPIDNSVTIEKVEIVVQAEKLSRADARKQAKMVIEEMKSINKENMIKSYR